MERRVVDRAVSRGDFLLRLGGGGAGLALIAAATGCQSFFARTAESLSEGAIEGAENELEEAGLKDDVEEAVRDVAATAENLRAITDSLRPLLENPENRENVRQTLENVRVITGDLAFFTTRARRLVELLQSITNPALLLAALVYFFHRLVAMVGRAVAEVILWLLYYLYRELVRELAERLRRQYWWLPWVGVVY